MTALSIPERARETERIAKRLYDNYEYAFQAHTAKTRLYIDICETVGAAMRSERELCAKELRNEAKKIDDGRAKNVAEAGALNRAAELLCEGGQK